MTVNLPYVLYLDQNKWIELAQSANESNRNPKTFQLLKNILQRVDEGRLLVPLSQTNLYETHKINNPDRRSQLAYIQATVSQGWFFRSLGVQVTAQLEDFFTLEFGLPTLSRPPLWYLTRLFYEAAAEYDPEEFGFEISTELINQIQKNPASALFSYLTTIPDEGRRDAVRKYTKDSATLIRSMLDRSEATKNEVTTVRKRAYSACLIVENIDKILNIASQLSNKTVLITDLGQKTLKSLAEKVPAFAIECELATKTESEDRVQNENDLRDVYSFTVVLPYADAVIAENAVTSRARQAKLGTRYSTNLNTSIHEWQMPLDE